MSQMYDHGELPQPMNRHHYPDRTPGILNVEDGQTLKELLDGRAGELLKFYGDRTPQAVEATFRDGDGHVYKGTLYLVEEKAMSEQAKHDGNLDVFADSYHYLRVDWHGNGIEIKDATYQFVELSPKQALSLLAWLQQEQLALEQLAREQHA